MKINLDPVFRPAFEQLPVSGVIISGDDSVSVRVFGPENNNHWSKVAMDNAVETATRINTGGLIDATTTTLLSKKGTEVIVVLHKK